MAIKTLQKNVTTAGTPVQLSSDLAVGSGVPCLIKAKALNTGSICVGKSSAEALNSDTQHFKLAAGEAVQVRVANLNEVWIDSTVNGEGVEIILEPII